MMKNYRDSLIIIVYKGWILMDNTLLDNETPIVQSDDYKLVHEIREYYGWKVTINNLILSL